jgi:hypothetical protein
VCASNILQRLTELERAYNGPIPPPLLEIARHGSPSAVSLLYAAARRAFYGEAVRRQIRIIRKRRDEGSLYPALLVDLRFYRDRFRDAQRCYRACAPSRRREA